MSNPGENNLLSDLQNLVRKIPINWGAIQNDNFDNKINMFQINSFIELELSIKHLSENEKIYFRRRWFLWKCSQCDEYLFCKNQNVRPNPNKKDQNYDIEFNLNSNLRFDIKGTIIPKKFRNNITEVLENPILLVDFFYMNQSKGVRNNLQNRLFIIHHSYYQQERELYLRCHWALKEKIFSEYSEKIKLNNEFIRYNGVISDLIYIFENKDKTITSFFQSVI